MANPKPSYGMGTRKEHHKWPHFRRQLEPSLDQSKFSAHSATVHSIRVSSVTNLTIYILFFLRESLRDKPLRVIKCMGNNQTIPPRAVAREARANLYSTHRSESFQNVSDRQVARQFPSLDSMRPPRITGTYAYEWQPCTIVHNGINLSPNASRATTGQYVTAINYHIWSATFLHVRNKTKLHFSFANHLGG